MSKLDNTITQIGPLDELAMAHAHQRQNSLTKPAGSLGRLEELSIKVAGIQRTDRPQVSRKAIIVMAADHGVCAEGVSAYPTAVTRQMVDNFLRGGAGVNVLARHIGARVVVADVGVGADLPPNPDLLLRKVAWGTTNIARGPAMTPAQAQRAIEAGIEVVEAEIERGLDLVGTGDMGIGNTTPSSAIIAAVTGEKAAVVTGRGTGLDDLQLQRKVSIVEQALAVNCPDSTDGLDILAKVGGLEIGALAGVILGAAAHHVVVVIDGFVSGAAAIIATLLCPRVKDYLVASHLSVEIGHQYAIRWLGLDPLLKMNMRLGEGTGAALGISLVEAGVKTLNEMSTFAEAGVTEADAKTVEGT